MNESTICDAPKGSKTTWEFTNSEEWGDKVTNFGWQVDQHENWILRGTCPDCKHPMKLVIPKVIGFQQSLESEYRACNCRCPHERREDGRDSGCGSGGPVTNPGVSIVLPTNEGAN